ncbi:Protein FAM113A [Tupaia chinensis]|uniref:Protein FAM113A n=1 Tax=Tupaia chinensis TaxID=246437 RepID=L8YEI9_TUPCH|nr:Protein FAM113A [Tupaia chinensis]
MVFCLENEELHLPLRSTMVHFQASEVQQLLHNKFVVILGDSIQRSVYKDLVLLLQKDSLLTAAQLKAKGELSFEQDQLVAGGQLGELHNGTQYREVRQFCSGSGHHLVRFYFLTRVYSEYLEGILEELTYGPAPDLVIINSCLWDLSRYGRFSMESYRENLERVFVRMDQVLPDSCLLVWNMAMPLGERVTGGFLLPEASDHSGQGGRQLTSRLGMLLPHPASLRVAQRLHFLTSSSPWRVLCGVMWLKGTSTVLHWLGATALMSWTSTFTSGMQYSTVIETVSTGTNMHTATSPTCF